MFEKARIKLTAQYLVIITIISFFFSVIIYEGATFELTRIEKAQRLKRPGVGVFAIDPEVLDESRDRIVLTLLEVNGFIFCMSAIAGYFLAGKTLNPIAKMVSDQKDFVSSASHELKTPLTALRSEIEVSLRNKKLTLKAAKDQLKSNLEEVNKISSLSNYLLKLNKFREVKNLHFRRLNLAKVAENAIEKIKPIAEAKKIEIVRDLKNKDVKADKESLVEVVTILLDNAIKYSKKESKVTVRTGKFGISVIDSGIGIEKKDLDHIFDKFYRADLSRSKEASDGFGLGLSIAKNIVKAHGGEIKVRSKPGKGSTFTVSI